ANITPGPILQHPQVSESDVVKNTVELTDTFERATFLNRDINVDRILAVYKVDITGEEVWRSNQLRSYNSIQEFIDKLEENTPLRLEYKDDRFIFTNTGQDELYITDQMVVPTAPANDGFLYAARFRDEDPEREGIQIKLDRCQTTEVVYTPQISQDVSEWRSERLNHPEYTSIDRFLETVNKKSGTVSVFYNPVEDRFKVTEYNGNPFGLGEENVSLGKFGFWGAVNITPNTQLTHPQISTQEVVKDTIELTDTFERATFANYKNLDVTRYLSINEGVEGIDPWISKQLKEYSSIQQFIDDVEKNTNIRIEYRDDRFILRNDGPHDVILMDVDSPGSNPVTDGFLSVALFKDEDPDVIGTQVLLKPKGLNTSNPQPAYVEGRIESGDVSDVDLSKEGSGYSLNGEINGKMSGKMTGILFCKANRGAQVPFDLKGKIDTKQVVEKPIEKRIVKRVKSVVEVISPTATAPLAVSKAERVREKVEEIEIIEREDTLQALVDIEGLTIISGIGDITQKENSVSGEIEGHIQGLAGDARIDLDGLDRTIPTNPGPGRDYSFDLDPLSPMYPILSAAGIEGDVTGVSAGRIKGYVEGYVWDSKGRYKGYLEQEMDGDYMISGRVTGKIKGISFGKISGKVLGEIYAKTINANTNLPEAMINGRIIGEVNDGEVVVEGHVWSRGDKYSDHIGAWVDVEGEAGEIGDVTYDFSYDDLYANLQGKLEGTLLGNAEGYIDGLVKHARIDSQLMEGEGYLKQNPDGKNYALIKWDGTLEGKLNDYGDKELPDPLTGVKAGEVAKEIYSMMDRLENPNPATDPAANSDNQLS
ncbi:MAG: hypothetical protein QME40_07945, partial [bacterium]|nr:hypothetical protein [bacterium]